MARRIPVLILSVSLLIIIAACNGGGAADQSQADHAGPAISGRIEAGLRVLTVDPTAAEPQNFTIYRGDYVRLESTTGQAITIVIPDLDVNKSYPVAEGEKAYFKVPQVGSYPFTAGSAKGAITAVDLVATGYAEVSAAEGAALISNVDPFILDVRTAGEFSDGHLKDAHLVPVQVLQEKLGELAAYKDKPVFVYCRSGNRSTVAARLLIDHGFTSVTNLNGGIKAWTAAGLPVQK